MVILLTAVLMYDLKRLIEHTRVSAQGGKHGIALDARVAFKDVAIFECGGAIEVGQAGLGLP